MTEKDMKRLTRYQLLELLILQSAQVDALQKQLEEAQKQLQDRKLQMEAMGSLAEASVQLSGVLEAAQNAADLFLTNARERIAALEAEAAEQAAEIIRKARQQAKKILEQAQSAADASHPDDSERNG